MDEMVMLLALVCVRGGVEYKWTPFELHGMLMVTDLGVCGGVGKWIPSRRVG